jgi:hypothetical protein
MFLSHEDLKLSYGVDMEIGKFLVDRRVPPENAYWKKRLLYLNFLPGYIFIPLFADIQFRLGLPKAELMSDHYMNFVESILDSAGRQEFEGISMEDHIHECLELTRTVSRNPEFLQDLIYYFKGEKEKATVKLGTPFPALARADAYLFSLCYFSFDAELKKKLVNAWYALITYFLVVDDMEDIRKDFIKNDENSLLESGLSKEGADKIMAMLDRDYEIMDEINPVLANRIDFTRKTKNVHAIIDSFLKEQSKV